MCLVPISMRNPAVYGRVSVVLRGGNAGDVDRLNVLVQLARTLFKGQQKQLGLSGEAVDCSLSCRSLCSLSKANKA